MTLSSTLPRAAVAVDTARSPFARLRPVSWEAVHLQDEFWEPRRRINRNATLRSQFEHLETSGCLDNFRRLSGEKPDIPFRGPIFMDSDLYKWLEAASSALTDGNDPQLISLVDQAITLLEGAQEPNGYLNTCFSRERLHDRYINLRDWHEMYCAGHLIQAAVAHYRATGSPRLLTIACRVADNLCDTFGPEAEGKIVGVDGHPEIEMALVELYRATGEARYREQAAFFIEVRGRTPSACYDRRSQSGGGGNAYHQDHIPYRDLGEVTGHAVRMLYLAAGAADLYLETGEPALQNALERQWGNMVERRVYVSGGLGSRWEGEAFGKDYELPNERAYTETCAAIASVMWNHRMLLATAEARFADLIEWTLYNAVLPGLSLEGEAYFYQNLLADDGKHQRKPWFGCACCPPNVARLLAQLPSYFYGVSEEGVWAHLYAAGMARIGLPDGREVEIVTETHYPWEGEVALTVQTPGAFSLFLRIPGWCEGDAAPTLLLNNTPQEQTLLPGSYVRLEREWQVGDVVSLQLPLPVRTLEAHPYALENTGRVALTRGPLLYCIEQADNPGIDLRDVVSPDPDMMTATFRPDLLGGLVTLTGPGSVNAPSPQWNGQLYRTRDTSAFPRGEEKAEVQVTALPYYAWPNREPGPMQVWLRGPG